MEWMDAYLWLLEFDCAISSDITHCLEVIRISLSSLFTLLKSPYLDSLCSLELDVSSLYP